MENEQETISLQKPAPKTRLISVDYITFLENTRDILHSLTLLQDTFLKL